MSHQTKKYSEKNTEIIELKNNACASGATINQYVFQNIIVFAFDQGHCIADGATEIYTESCELIGFLGGISGNDKINGVNFAQNAKLIKKVWAN